MQSSVKLRILGCEPFLVFLPEMLAGDDLRSVSVHAGQTSTGRLAPSKTIACGGWLRVL